MHMDEVGTSFIAGSLGGLKLIDVDTTGGDLALSEARRLAGGSAQQPTLEFFGYEDGLKTSKIINCQENGRKEAQVDPRIALYNDNQVHWAAYLRGELDDSTRIDSPYIAMETALLSDAIFISQAQHRSVTGEEVRAMSQSVALHRQETPWGVIEYDF